MTYYSRPESLQRALLAEAERLLALKKRPKRARSTTNAIPVPADNEAAQDAMDEAQRNAVASELVKRLAVRDRGLT